MRIDKNRSHPGGNGRTGWLHRRRDTQQPAGAVRRDEGGGRRECSTTGARHRRARCATRLRRCGSRDQVQLERKTVLARSETGYFHPDCGHKAWCIGVTRRPAAGSATPGLVEIRVGRWAPAFDRTLEWRINHRQGFPSDPYLAAELKVRDRGCGHDQLLGIEGPDCIVKILPDQISSMHDRRGRPRTKRALKTIVTDFWNPNPGFGRNDDCDSPWDARLTMVVQEITGFGRTEGTVPVRVCR